MSHYTMPFLFVNLGGEMMYVLQQRLQAQNVSNDKSRRVLQDVISSMFDESLVKDFERPQPLYSQSSVRGVFNRLAHSSIMRLNTQSMEKLFDLMTMGIKYQLLQCHFPNDVLDMTMNHLDAMSLMAGASSNAHSCVIKIQQEIRALSTRFSSHDFALVRQVMLSFFHGRNLKVSVFLFRGIQDRDTGDISISIDETSVLPQGFDTPGLVRYLNYETGEVEESRQLKRPLSGMYPPHAKQLQERRRILGANMYHNYKSSTTEDWKQCVEDSGRAKTKYTLKNVRVVDNRTQNPEIALMTNMLLGGRTADAETSGPMALWFGKKSSGFGSYDLEDRDDKELDAMERIDIFANKGEALTLDTSHKRDGYMNELWGTSTDGNISTKKPSDDLLDLLDEAGY